MGFWIFCLAMNLLLPVIMLFFGRCFQRKPPETINGVYGYRTARSMKSQQTWDFAHRYCGRLWFRLRLILLPVSTSGKHMCRSAVSGQGERHSWYLVCRGGRGSAGSDDRKYFSCGARIKTKF